MMMNMNMMMIMVLINYEIASITGCASFVLACFWFCFLCMFLPAFAIFFFSFVLSFFFFLSLLSLFRLYSVFPPPDSKYTTGYQSVLGSHTHIRKINSHSRLLKVKISSGVVLGDCRVGFCNVSFSVHTVLYSFAHCSMQASSFYLSAVSHWWWHE